MARSDSEDSTDSAWARPLSRWELPPSAPEGDDGWESAIDDLIDQHYCEEGSGEPVLDSSVPALASAISPSVDRETLRDNVPASASSSSHSVDSRIIQEAVWRAPAPAFPGGSFLWESPWYKQLQGVSTPSWPFAAPPVLLPLPTPVEEQTLGDGDALTTGRPVFSFANRRVRAAK